VRCIKFTCSPTPLHYKGLTSTSRRCPLVESVQLN